MDWTGKWSLVRCESEHPRLDTYLAAELKLSRNRIQKLIVDGLVKWNNESTRANQPLAAGDTIEFFIPKPEPLELSAEDIPLTIYFEDEHLAVIEKPAGLVVHPGAGHSQGTLVNALLHHFKHLSNAGGIGGKLRPGIVHRIDRNTSGVLLITKTDLAHQSLSAQFKAHSISRKYTGMCWGELPAKGEWNAPIDRDPKERKRMAIVPEGRQAITRYESRGTLAKISLFEATLLTGRTHQIRVHFSAHGFPLVGDALYTLASRGARQKKEEGLRAGKKYPPLMEKLIALEEKSRQFLHANHLGFDHPATGKKMSFDSPLPADLEEIMIEWKKC